MRSESTSGSAEGTPWAVDGTSLADRAGSAGGAWRRRPARGTRSPTWGSCAGGGSSQGIGGQRGRHGDGVVEHGGGEHATRSSYDSVSGTMTDLGTVGRRVEPRGRRSMPTGSVVGGDTEPCGQHARLPVDGAGPGDRLDDRSRAGSAASATGINDGGTVVGLRHPGDRASRTPFWPPGGACHRPGDVRRPEQPGRPGSTRAGMIVGSVELGLGRVLTPSVSPVGREHSRPRRALWRQQPELRHGDQRRRARSSATAATAAACTPSASACRPARFRTSARWPARQRLRQRGEQLRPDRRHGDLQRGRLARRSTSPTRRPGWST